MASYYPTPNTLSLPPVPSLSILYLQVPLDRILEEVNQSGSRPDPFDEEEVHECIDQMMQDNQIYLDMGTRAVFFI